MVSKISGQLNGKNILRRRVGFGVTRKSVKSKLRVHLKVMLALIGTDFDMEAKVFHFANSANY